MLNKPLVRLPALLTLLVVGGCNHFPSLGSLNFFSEPNPEAMDILVVESAPAERRVDPVAPQRRPAPIHQDLSKVRPEVKPAAISELMPSPEAAPLPASNSVSPAVSPVLTPMVAGSTFAANAVALGDTQGVLDLPPTYWAVQIAAVKNIERVAELVKEHELEGMLGVPMNTQAGPLHAVLTGVFVKREDALASIENLPAVLAGYQPWVRPLAHLQAAMR